MSVTKAEFKQIFTAAVAQEFCHIPGTEKISYTFSKAFLRKKEKLIKNTRKTTWYWVNTAAKRAAVIVLLLAMLFSIAMSVEAIRDPVITFFTEYYEEYFLMVYEGEGRGEIEHAYGFSQLPKGYEITEVVSNPAGVIITLENTEGETIIFDQGVTRWAKDNAISNEHGRVTEILYGDLPVVAYEHEEGVSKLISWVYDGYVFMITHHGKLPITYLLDLIKVIE